MASTTTGSKPTTIQFTYHDPGRTFDGTPYEAAGKAVVQVSQVVKLLRRAVEDTSIQVRNSYMQRNIDLGNEAGAENWTGSPEQKLLANFVSATSKMQTKLSTLYRSTTWNPNEKEKA